MSSFDGKSTQDSESLAPKTLWTMKLSRDTDAPVDAWRIRLPPISISPTTTQSSIRSISLPSRAPDSQETPSTPPLPSSQEAPVSPTSALRIVSRQLPSATTGSFMLPLTTKDRVMFSTRCGDEEDVIYIPLEKPGDVPRRKAQELAETVAYSETISPGIARRGIATLLKTAAAADQEDVSPDEMQRQVKRLLNRASVQKCRRLKRARNGKLEKERATLEKENAALNQVKMLVEGSGVLNLICQMRLVRTRDEHGISESTGKLSRN